MGTCSSRRTHSSNSERVGAFSLASLINGHRLRFGTSDTHANQLQLSGQWELLKSGGQVPCERSGHAVVVHHGKAFLFGGYGGQVATHLSDFYLYDFGSTNWKAITASENVPCPRTAFTMCVTPESLIYLWGGTDHDLQGLEDQQLYEFDICTSKWNIITATNTNILTLRYFGRSSDYYNKKILFFGGGVKGGRFTNELITFDLENKRWERIETTGDVPCPRYKHQSCVVGHRLFVIGGGCYLPPEETVDTYALCLKTFVWSRVQTTGKLPEGRAAHTCEFDSVTNAIYLWGGFNQSLVPLFDFYKLDLKTYQWSVKTTVKENSIWPGRSFHSSCFYKGGLYSFNGSDGECRFADLMRFQIHCSPPRLTNLAVQSCSTNIDRKKYFTELPEELQKQMDFSRDSLDSGYRVPFS